MYTEHCRKSAHFWVVSKQFYIGFENENSYSHNFLFKVRQNIKTAMNFTDQSEVSALPAGCTGSKHGFRVQTWYIHAHSIRISLVGKNISVIIHGNQLRISF